eukprot:4865581-Pyramimonas_sp.AAC.1
MAPLAGRARPGKGGRRDLGAALHAAARRQGAASLAAEKKGPRPGLADERRWAGGVGALFVPRSWRGQSTRAL